MDKFAAKAAPTVKGKIVGAALAAKSVNWKMKDAKIRYRKILVRNEDETTFSFRRSDLGQIGVYAYLSQHD